MVMDATTAALVVVDILMVLIIISTNIFAIVLIMKRSKKNSKNILLVSLSVSDIAIAVFVIPNVKLGHKSSFVSDLSLYGIHGQRC